MALHKVVGGVQEAMNAPASTIGINNGSEAGQEVPHLHIHIIPISSREEGGIIQSIVRRGGGSGSLSENAEKIREALSLV
jgi:histidine triad (HIT) family protein